ncbi:2Fe-2S iron-sulfur cluster binding domain-containing protein [Flavobacterium silvisoli]|uniref:2Fe-2S iron-sulfur cluster binding domain-containing protein n=1 Tax=Flavobacterium silvisoli TaxID=2529433 RepID=A0A4Q9YQ40_9FLAO|nr:FAD binding domain-containing protein [Flavobacterium silvisoli]TBX65570.1 2Fe-2S iron-sulfur cluster binding domain-containing protein [Flavobacterium silvisoli]
MIQFILNNRLVQTDRAASTTLLDFIRYDENLRGTKIGCREGDCGACTVLIGSLKEGKAQYISATSCLTPLANVYGKHVVTVEGLNLPEKLNQVQQAMVDCSGTQCGFCTPGFVNSMSGFALTCSEPTVEKAISAIDGNICRCTGYKTIERAAAKVTEQLLQKDQKNPLSWLVANSFVPDYFLTIEERLKEFQSDYSFTGQIPIGGGTDLYVQKHDELHDMDMDYLFDKKELNGIIFEGNQCKLKSSVTVSDLIENETLLHAIPNWYKYLKLLSSTPIRNIATIAGNIANGSPIGDFTIILLAMKAQLTLTNKENVGRKVMLKDFYLGYKTFDKKKDEIISEITFEVPASGKFNFEKVCKRQYLDIASVNTAMVVSLNRNTIADADVSMGGVGPIPKYLTETSAFLIGKELTATTVKEAEQLLQTELAPISDARGTEEYKRLLARQLFFAHFITLFPETIKIDNLL